MNIDTLFRFLLWCLAFNYSVLLIWFLVFVFGRRWLRGLERRWFTMSDATSDAIHFGGMAAYEIGILLLNAAPVVALYFLRGG